MFLWTLNSFASVSQFSCSVMSDSLQPHGLQHTRPPCPSPTPRVSSNSCPLSRDAVQPSHSLPSPSLPSFNLWDSPGKNTGVGCHFLLQCTKVKSESEVAQSCPTLSNLMDCSLPGSSVHGIFQARVLEWGVIAFSESYV